MITTTPTIRPPLRPCSRVGAISSSVLLLIKTGLLVLTPTRHQMIFLPLYVYFACFSVQAIIKYFGDLIVLILTKVVGRSIGLIGRGIAQGMGKNLSKG